MTDGDLERAHCFRRRNRAWRERWVGDDAQKSRLRDRARRPPFAAMPGEPMLRQVMKLMARPRECDQDVHVQKKYAHSPSNSSSLTRSLVMRGESGGTSITSIPLTMRMRTGAFRPFRTNSETALPNGKDCPSAYRRATVITSSSRRIVVRMLSMMPQTTPDVKLDRTASYCGYDANCI